jgi:hypothetical protein
MMWNNYCYEKQLCQLEYSQNIFLVSDISDSRYFSRYKGRYLACWFSLHTWKATHIFTWDRGWWWTQPAVWLLVLAFILVLLAHLTRAAGYYSLEPICSVCGWRGEMFCPCLDPVICKGICKCPLSQWLHAECISAVIPHRGSLEHIFYVIEIDNFCLLIH